MESSTPTASADSVRLLVHLPTHPQPLHEPVTVYVSKHATISDVKHTVAQLPGRPDPERMRIIWSGRSCSDSQFVRELLPGGIQGEGEETPTVALHVVVSTWTDPGACSSTTSTNPTPSPPVHKTPSSLPIPEPADDPQQRVMHAFFNYLCPLDPFQRAMFEKNLESAMHILEHARGSFQPSSSYDEPEQSKESSEIKEWHSLVIEKVETLVNALFIVPSSTPSTSLSTPLSQPIDTRTLCHAFNISIPESTINNTPKMARLQALHTIVRILYGWFLQGTYILPVKAFNTRQHSLSYTSGGAYSSYSPSHVFSVEENGVRFTASPASFTQHPSYTTSVEQPSAFLRSFGQGQRRQHQVQPQAQPQPPPQDNAANLARVQQLRRRFTGVIVIDLGAVLSLVMITLKLSFLLYVLTRNASPLKRAILWVLAGLWVLWEGFKLLRRRPFLQANPNHLGQQQPQQRAQQPTHGGHAPQSQQQQPQQTPHQQQQEQPLEHAAVEEQHETTEQHNRTQATDGNRTEARNRDGSSGGRSQRHRSSSARPIVKRIVHWLAYVGLNSDWREDRAILDRQYMVRRRDNHDQGGPGERLVPWNNMNVQRYMRRTAIALILFLGTLVPEVEKKRKRALEKKEKMRKEYEEYLKASVEEKLAAIEEKRQAKNTSPSGGVIEKEQGEASVVPEREQAVSSDSDDENGRREQREEDANM